MVYVISLVLYGNIRNDICFVMDDADREGAYKTVFAEWTEKKNAIIERSLTTYTSTSLCSSSWTVQPLGFLARKRWAVVGAGVG